MDDLLVTKDSFISNVLYLRIMHILTNLNLMASGVEFGNTNKIDPWKYVGVIVYKNLGMYLGNEPLFDINNWFDFYFLFVISHCIIIVILLVRIAAVKQSHE